jgi:hypothetical protein
MVQVRRLFDAGASVPVSDVGLVSTQEDVNRKPIFNHIAAFSNSALIVYLLVQKAYRKKKGLLLHRPRSHRASAFGLLRQHPGREGRL